MNHERNYEILGAVLRSRQISHPPHAKHIEISYKINWDGSLRSEDLIVPRVTCFCDIPYDSLGIHVAKYGRFGVAFDRAFLADAGARPVIYLPLRPRDPRQPWGSIHGDAALRHLEAVYRGFYEQVVHPVEDYGIPIPLGKKPDSRVHAIMALNSSFVQDILAFVKPFDVDLDPEHLENYYMEREWRRYGNLVFRDSDIRMVIVSSGFAERFAADFPALANRLQTIG